MAIGSPQHTGQGFLVSHNCSHRALSLWGAVWSLPPSAPHAQGPGAPSPVPKSPFTYLGCCHVHPLSCCLQHLVLGFFYCCCFLFFFKQSSVSTTPLLWGFIHTVSVETFAL